MLVLVREVSVNGERRQVGIQRRRPVLSNFWSNGQVGVRSDVGTERCFVNRECSDSVYVVGLPPFHTTAEPEAIVDPVQQVLVNAHVVFLRLVDTKNIALQDVIQFVGEREVEHKAVHVSVIASPAEVTNRADVGQLNVVGQRCGETTEPVAAIAKLIESSVPTGRPASVDFQIVVEFKRADKTGVCERLAEVHGVRMAVEEVTWGGNDFVANQRVEVTSLDGPAVACNFTVELRNGPAINAVSNLIGSETVSEVPNTRVVAEGLGVLSVNTVHDVCSETPIDSAATRVCGFFDVRPSLVQIQVARMIVEQAVGFVVVTKLKPTADVPAGILTE